MLHKNDCVVFIARITYWESFTLQNGLPGVIAVMTLLNRKEVVKALSFRWGQTVQLWN